MSAIQDLEQILTTVLPTDPSFRSIKREEMDRHIHKVRKIALAGSTDDFLLGAMRLLARANNGHSRLIPNQAISVFPLRFVTIGSAVRLLDAAPDFSEAIGAELQSINGVPLDDIEARSLEFLGGTRQRKRVIGPILYAWPGALRHLRVPSRGDWVEYQMRDQTGRAIELRLDPASLVSGSTFYPTNEHGRTSAAWAPHAFLEVIDFGNAGLLMSLPSFFDPGGSALPKAISDAAELARSRASAPMVIDLRGNTGGDFLQTMPLIEALAAGAGDRRVAALVDKFTFSAAIVFVAILKHRLGRRFTIVGEEMGDGLTFFAEGGSIELASSGAIVRYSSAFHDWAGGSIDETTPAEIAAKIVPVGTLELDRIWVSNADDVHTRDQFCLETLKRMAD